MAVTFDALRQHILTEYQACLRPAVDRFAHEWVGPMPLSNAGHAYLKARTRGISVAEMEGGQGSDGFTSGDYSLGLFHHDASESAIELLQHPAFAKAAGGSLLCLLDTAAPDGCVHRIELPHKSREAEPSKPVIAQYALRCAEALGADWLIQHRVVPRVEAFIRYTERHYFGMHGLFLTHSALQSGFDSDLLSAGVSDKRIEGPDTNAFMVLEYRALAKLHSLLGKDGSKWEEKADRLSRLMNALCWFEDERGGFYVALNWNRGAPSLESEIVSGRTPDGSLRPLETWASLLPLYAGIPSNAQAEQLIRRLTRAEGYWGPQGVRTQAADDVYFHQAPRILLYDHKKKGPGPVSNWTGPVWVLSNYYLAEGCARYGRTDLAQELSFKTARLLSQGLDAEGALRECYDDAGRGLWPRHGTFLSWNILALTLLRRFPPSGPSL